ncbi:MAG: sigma-70 family RNA polymerase sigma factor [Deltaproteobacteria bacterium]|nr:sigma-70 family RNA polymerase sigma factor [Deltaproteobacteria bacterium]
MDKDRALVRRCKRGDRSAFKELVELYQKKVFVVAYGMVHNADDAMDIAQEAFVKIHRNLRRFKGTSSFYTWIYRIVLNLSIDFLRREGRLPTVDFDDTMSHDQVADGGDFAFTHATEDPGMGIDKRRMSAILHRAIDDLSANHRAAIVLREIEGLSYSEIAKIMDCSEGTVMSRLHHARLRLQSALKGFVEKGEA